MPDLNAQQFAYRGHHQPPQAGEDFGAPMHDLTRLLPEDVYNKPHYYSGSSDYEMQSALRRAKGNPDAPITVYRALPKPHREINPGDWVTPSRGYARMHAQGNIGDPSGAQVVASTVPARHLMTHGDDLQEWGYVGSESKHGEVIWRGRRSRAKVTE